METADREDLEQRGGLTAARVLESRVVFAGALALLVAAGGAGAFLCPLNQDAAFFLHCGERMLDGARLYRDIMDMNMPLSFYASMLPAWLGRALGVPSTAVLNVCVLAMVAVSLALCARLLHLVMADRGLGDRRCVLLVLAFVMLLGSADNYGKSNLGQKEHVMFVTAAPYLLAAAARAMGAPVGAGIAFFVGLFAGVGMAQKPNFLAAWGVVELYLFLRGRCWRVWLRPENAGVVLVHAVYGLFILWRTPEYLRLVPLMKQGYFSYEGAGLASVFLNGITKLCVLAFVCHLLVRTQEWNRELRRILALACVGFLLSAISRFKGWYYHYYPAQAAALLLLTVLVLGIKEKIEQVTCSRATMRWAAPVIPVILALLGMGGGGALVNMHRWTRSSSVPQFVRLLREHAAGRPVCFLSYSALSPAFPAVNYSGARWCLRFGNLWQLAGIYPAAGAPAAVFPYHARAEMGQVERMLFDGVVEDVVRARPEVVAVDSGDLYARAGAAVFDYVEYFSHDRGFAEAWKEYELLARVDTFQVFRRKPGAGEADASQPAASRGAPAPGSR